MAFASILCVRGSSSESSLLNADVDPWLTAMSPPIVENSLMLGSAYDKMLERVSADQPL